MADKYANYAELETNEVEGTDYTRNATEVLISNVIFFTPHGGGIEPGTTELSEQTSNLLNTNCYTFDGIKSSNNFDLHITSTNFDEPIALDIVGKSSITLSYHGYSDDNEKLTYIGGLDHDLRALVEQELLAKGFNASNEPPTSINGENVDNITNKNKRGKGVQLELSTRQRRAFFQDGDLSAANRVNTTAEFDEYVNAIGNALVRAFKLAPMLTL